MLILILLDDVFESKYGRLFVVEFLVCTCMADLHFIIVPYDEGFRTQTYFKPLFELPQKHFCKLHFTFSVTELPSNIFNIYKGLNRK